MLYSRDSEFIREVLTMPEWDDPKFQGLLTSNIWNSNVSDVKEILQMPEWNDLKYKHLLVPSIFGISYKNIRPTMDLFEEYGIC